MANLPVVFDITATTAPVEISTDGGVNWTLLTVSGSTHKTGNALNIAPNTYAVGQLQLRAVGYSSSMISNTGVVTIAGVAKTATVVLWIGQSNDSGLSPRTNLPAAYYNQDARIRSWDKTTAIAGTYSLGSIDTVTGFPTGNNDHGIDRRIVANYDNGIGPDVGFVYAWQNDAANAGKELFVFKKDLTPPVSTDGASIKAWLVGINPRPPIYTGFLQEWTAFKSYLTAQGYTTINTAFICGIGEQDSVDYTNLGGGTNPDFATSLTTFISKFRTDGVLAANSPVIIAQKQRPNNIDATIAAAQATYVNNNPSFAKLAVLPYLTAQASSNFLAVDSTHYTQEAILRLGALEYSLYAGAFGGVGAAAEQSTSTPPWVAPNFLVTAGVTSNAGVWSTTSTLNDWASGGALNTAYRAPSSEARVRMKFTDNTGLNAALGFAANPSYNTGGGTSGNVYSMEYMFFVTNSKLLGIHRFGLPVSATIPVTDGHYYCLKISAAGRVTVEESITGDAWVVVYVFAQDANTATRPYYAQFGLYNNFSNLQYPQTNGFVAVLSAAITNQSGSTWDVATFNVLSSDTSYSNGIATTSGGNTFGHMGVNTITTRASNAVARLGFRYYNDATTSSKNGLVGFDERSTLIGVTTQMRYGFYIGSAGTLIITDAGSGVDTGYACIPGQYYALHITGAGTVSVEESTDNYTWTERYRFLSGYTSALYAHFDLYGSATTLSNLQSQGLGAATGTVTPTPATTFASFTTDPTVVYDGAGNYTTNSSTNGWAHTVMGTNPLLANQEGIIHMLFKGDGTDGLAIIGLHNSSVKYPSYNIYAGIYIEPKGAGAYGLRMLSGTNVNGTFALDPVVANTRYGVQRKADGTINVVSNSGSGWVIIRQLTDGITNLSFTGTLTAGLSVLANGSDVNVPNPKASDVRQTW